MANLPAPFAQSLSKDIDKGRVSGMSYRIDGEAVYTRNKPRTLYFIQIDGWDYTIRNESREYPLLSFSYMDKGQCLTQTDKAVRNVRVLNRSVRGYRVPEKTVRAAAYLMQQIAAGNVPDAHRVFGLYRMIPQHPLVPGFFQDSFSYANGLFRDGE